MGTAGGERLGGSTINRGRRSIDAGRYTAAEFAQDGIDEWSGGAFASALDEFHALIDCSTGRNAAEPAKLVNRESECGENLEIEFGDRL